ncbi:MAG: glycosyltransferase family 4 protein, partial [Candidatus Latescibacterota bacterium]
SLFGKLRRIDADVYVQRCAGVETGIVAYFCRPFRKPWLFSVASDADLDGRFESGNPYWIRRGFRYGIRSAGEVVCQNGVQRESLNRRFGRSGRTILSLCEVPGSYPEPDGGSILWVSRCVPLKQPERFIELARELPDLRFVMIMNDGPDPAYNSTTFANARSVENLELIRHVAYQDIDVYFRNARVLVSTAEFEGFPNAFLQAMKHGVPVVSFAVNPNEILTRERAGLFADGDFGRLKEAVLRLATDDNIHLELSRNAFDYVSRHHDLRKLTELYKQLLRGLLD